MEIDERVAFAKEADYQYLKGKHEGIKLALDILNRRDVHPTSVRWLAKEKGVIEYQIELLEKKMYATTYKPMTIAQKMGWPLNAQGEEE